jgi:hypothetical protein
MTDHAKGCGGCTRAAANFNNPVMSQPRKKSSWALLDAVRGLVNQVYMPPLLITHCTSFNSIG